MKTSKSSKRKEIQLPFCCPEVEFEWHCGFVKDVYAQAIVDLQRAQENLRTPLADRFFKREASPELLHRVQDGAKMLRSITVQVRAALKAVADTPGEISECLAKEVA
jgi:hypothetical protein